MSSSSSCVTTSSGQIRGYWKKSSEGKDFLSFRGIPYAEAPSNELRFRLPEPAPAWNGIFDASRCGPPCPQFNPLSRDVIGDEDNCLTLNVYTRGFSREDPLGKTNLPVIVWIHGGAFAFGSGSDVFYGPHRAMNQAIVLVTINYRLGPLGFMGGAECPSNLGLHDQRLALEWTKTNATSFRGNPDNITLMGESAGAASAHLQMMASSQQRRRLFHRVILQSGSAWCPWALSRSDTSNMLYRRLCDQLGCNSVAELRAVDCRNLVKAAVKINVPGGHNFFLPTVPDDSAFFQTTTAASNIRQMPALVGINSQEAAFLTAFALGANGRRQLDLTDLLRVRLFLDKSEAIQVRQHYFPEPNVDDDPISSADRLTAALSDGLFVHPLYQMLRRPKSSSSSSSQHQTFFAAPCYVYKYSHRGEASLSQLMTTMPSTEEEERTSHNKRDFGVSHFDEVLLQFTNKLFTSPLSPDDQKVASFLWSTWAEFADKGHLFWPEYDRHDGQGVSGGQRGIYLDISLQPRIMSNNAGKEGEGGEEEESGLFHQADMDFWDELLLGRRHRKGRPTSAL